MKDIPSESRLNHSPPPSASLGGTLVISNCFSTQPLAFSPLPPPGALGTFTSEFSMPKGAHHQITNKNHRDRLIERPQKEGVNCFLFFFSNKKITHFYFALDLASYVAGFVFTKVSSSTGMTKPLLNTHYGVNHHLKRIKPKSRGI